MLDVDENNKVEMECPGCHKVVKMECWAAVDTISPGRYPSLLNGISVSGGFDCPDCDYEYSSDSGWIE